MKSEATNAIFASLDNNARFVGGAVRDALLEKDAKDIDIATPFIPDEVTSRLEKHGIKVIPTGIKHGTVTAVIFGESFEITTLRRDVDCTGRHAEVEFTDNWEEDTARRDFTINAMSCSQDGEVFDYFGGLEDLQNGKVKFVGDAKTRCREDYLRILRFFRFFAYYGQMPVDLNALDACRELGNGIESLSGERIQAEMLKLLAAPNPIYSLQLMVQDNVMPFVISDITISHIVYLENLLVSAKKRSKNPILRLSALLCYNIEAANILVARWKLSNFDKNRLLFLCDPENAIHISTDEKNAKKLLRSWGKENFLDIAMLGFAYGMDEEMFNHLYALENWSIPDFPLKGKDLLPLGLEQGKKMGDFLKIAEEWWEENDYKASKQELLAYVKTLHSSQLT